MKGLQQRGLGVYWSAAGKPKGTPGEILIYGELRAMRIWHGALVAASLLTAAAYILLGEERVAVTGKVVEAGGKPVGHATVLVYEAGVKKGYSIFCPTCYADCGKRTLTDAEGNFSIGGLSPDLLFTLLVVRDGYLAGWVAKADPAKGPVESVVLEPRPPIQDGSQVVRGRVMNGHGRPVRDAAVYPQEVTLQGEGGRTRTLPGGRSRGWIDPMAVTNDKGEFEIAFGQPALQMMLRVRPRGMAEKLFTVPTGPDRKTMTVTDGATIRGRLVHGGKPVADAEVGLRSYLAHSLATSYGEERIGTREDGTFAITNVPAGRIYKLYPKMESLARRNIGAEVVVCESKDDGQEVDVGDVQLKAAHRLSGKVVRSDGKLIPPNMRITLLAERTGDSQMAVLASDGGFEFQGLPPGVYEIYPAVKGYRVPEDPRQVLVNRDLHDLVIRMETGTGRP